MLVLSRSLLTLSIGLSAIVAATAAATPFAQWHTAADARFGPPLADGGRILEVRTRAGTNGFFGDRGYRFSVGDVLVEQLALTDNGEAVWDGGTGMIAIAYDGSQPTAKFYAATDRGSGSALPEYWIPALDSSANAAPTSFSAAPAPDAGAWFVGVTQGSGGLRTRLWKRAADGTPAAGWTASGRNLWTGDAYAWPIVASDGGSGAIVFGLRMLSSGLELFASRVLATGAPDSAWNHAPLVAMEAYPSAIHRVSGGYLLVFRGWLTLGVETWRALRITDTGALAPSWPDTGVVLGRTSLNEACLPFPDGADGLYFLDTSGSPRLRHVLGDGSHALGPDGVVVAPTGSRPVASRDGASGLLLAWTEDVAGLQRVRVRALDASGVTRAAWPDSGLPVSAPVAWHLQRPIAVTSDGTGGARVAWQDEHPQSFCCAEATLTRVAAPVVLDTPPPAQRTRLALALVGANPVRGTLHLALDCSNGADAQVELVDVSGRVLRRARLAGGSRRESTWSLAGIAPGVLLARATQAGVSVTQRVVVVQ